MTFIIKSDAQPNEKSNIIEKLVELRKTVTYLQKDARGAQFQYVSSASVLGALREKMDELGLMLFPRVIGKRCTVNTDGKGRNVYFTELDVDFTWVDQGSWDQVVVPFYAQGIDLGGEKGVGKALTYAEKYFLLKQFNIATDQDDPDSFQHRIDHSVQRYISKEQIAELDGFVQEISQLRNVPVDSVLATLNVRSLDKVQVEMYFGVRDQLLMMLNGARQATQEQPAQQPPQQNQANTTNPAITKNQGNGQPNQNSSNQSENVVKGTFILQNYTVAMNPQNVPFGKMEVTRKNTNEPLTVLVRDNQQMINSLNEVQQNAELQLVLKTENGFYFLQSYMGLTEQENGSMANSQPEQQVGSPQQMHPDAEQFEQFILNKIERGTSPNNVPFAKLYVTPMGSQDEIILFANTKEAISMTEGLQENTRVSLRARQENGWYFLEAVGVANAS